MRKRIFQVCLTIAFILLIIIAVKFIKSSNQGTPNQEQKGNPLKQPVSPK